MIFGKKKSIDEGVTEGSIFNKETEGLSQSQIVRKRFLQHKAAMIAVFILSSLVIFVFSALKLKIGPWTYPGWWKYGIEDLSDLTTGCKDGLVGCPTASLIGRDYFALVMRGAQRSLMVTVIIGFIGGVIGTVVGAVAGFYRGVVDSVLMRITDFIITIPSIIIGSVIGYHFGNLGVTFLAFYLGLFAWTGLSRLVRGEFLTLREREFVDAARVAGATNRRIIFKHILPNAVGIIIVSVTLLMSGAILLETALSFLGFGVVPPDVSLGLLISEYQDSFTTRPWLFWYPGIFIVTIALCINFIGDGLRDAFDPRQRRRITRKDRQNARIAKKAGAQL